MKASAGKIVYYEQMNKNFGTNLKTINGSDFAKDILFDLGSIKRSV